MKTKQDQINEMVLAVPQTIVAYDANPKGQHLYGEQRQQIAETLYEAGYRKTPNDIRELIDVLYEGAKLKEKLDEFEKCKKYAAWSGTDCTRNPYTEGCLDETINLKNEIKRLKKENANLLKVCEEQFTFDTTENKKYSIFNSVRKEFADKVTAKLFAIFGKTICSDLDTEDITDKIYESLQEYEE